MKPFDEVIHVPTDRRVTINLIGKSGTGMVVVTWIGRNYAGKLVMHRANVPWQSLRNLTPEELAEPVPDAATEAEAVSVAEPQHKHKGR